MGGQAIEPPQPNEHFRWVQDPAGPSLVCGPLLAVARHLFTTRPWALGDRAPNGVADAAWADVARALEVPVGRLARVRQVHGAGVVVARVPPADPPTADVIVALDGTLAIAVQAADCVPLLVADRRTGAVAAAHAGWRGLAAGVPLAAVAALAREFGSRPADLVVAIGPSIGACCYQVGQEVRDRFAGAGLGRDLKWTRWFRDRPAILDGNRPLPGLDAGVSPGRWFFDPWAAARDQLVAASVPPARIFGADLCTASHPGLLCSYRRDGAPAGRMAAAIRGGPPCPSRP